MGTKVQGVMIDDLWEDRSAILEELNVAYAQHELCSDFIPDAMSFIEQSSIWK